MAKLNESMAFNDDAMLGKCARVLNCVSAQGVNEMVLSHQSRGK